ncbi:MAG: putative molybdenum carrier protein [Gemmataceae bacterium]
MDRAALDVAIELGIPHDGWCPRGRRAEDGRIPDHYLLQETESTEYPVRTEKNVLDSDGTLILCLGEADRGTALTQRLAKQHQRHRYVVDLRREERNALADVRHWILNSQIRTLNVAGPRESSKTGSYAAAREFLLKLLKNAEAEMETVNSAS